MKNKSCPADFVLSADEKGAYLQYISDDNLGPIRIDFLSGKMGYRSKQLRNELIAKAVGVKGDFRPHIIDATAGLGGDTFLLASLGCRVIALEKNPMIASLLSDGLRRAAESEVVKNITLIESDALSYLEKLTEAPDVIYLDPMFPSRKKSAKVKKEMQILEALLGQEDATDLFEMALKKAKKRVVVKRPKDAPSLANKKPDIIYQGKTIRFDVYLIN
jgi:16S rRNA (guanine1516-N2)-methyltransferase